MKEINSDPKTVRELLANTKYQLDYYQREYSWQTKHVTELLDDLIRIFLESYTADDTLAEVSNYDHYFLGSIIISYNDGQRYIVDGQQRLTTLTLLLIKLYQWLEEGFLKNQVAQCIYSLSGGIEGFNLDVSEWHPIMEAFYANETLDESETSESIENILGCYRDIENDFQIPSCARECFAYWLLEKVYLVEVAASNPKDAYTIFETVNDRGLSLTPTDMLKGYLLSNIADVNDRNRASEIWREQIQLLQGIDKEENAEAIKAWLRSQYASHQDFMQIGSEFHRWVRDHNEVLGLTHPGGFVSFIERDFTFYSDWYHRLQLASREPTPGLECIYYNAQNNFTLQYPVILAPLRIEDTKTDILKKVRITATFLDIFIHRRIWNLQEIAQRSMVTGMCVVMDAIRGKNITELTDILYAYLESETLPFANNRFLQLQYGNRRKIFLILARMTDYVSVESGESSHFLDYMRGGKNRYEIEHIWSNHFEEHTDEFSHESEFQGYRDRIGGLLLLPKSDNASSGDDPYIKKRGVYSGQNLLARSLLEQSYMNNPGFRKFRETSGLNFKPYPEFKKADLDTRQELYLKLAEQIWNPERLRMVYSADPPIIIPNSTPNSVDAGGMIVTMNNGKTIEHHKVNDTWFEVITKLIDEYGGDQVMSADREKSRDGRGRIVGIYPNFRETNSPRPERQYREYYISMDYRTTRKKQLLRDLASGLGIQLEVV